MAHGCSQNTLQKKWTKWLDERPQKQGCLGSKWPNSRSLSLMKPLHQPKVGLQLQKLKASEGHLVMPHQVSQSPIPKGLQAMPWGPELKMYWLSKPLSINSCRPFQILKNPMSPLETYGYPLVVSFRVAMRSVWQQALVHNWPCWFGLKSRPANLDNPVGPGSIPSVKAVYLKVTKPFVMDKPHQPKQKPQQSAISPLRRWHPKHPTPHPLTKTIKTEFWPFFQKKQATPWRISHLIMNWKQTSGSTPSSKLKLWLNCKHNLALAKPTLNSVKSKPLPHSLSGSRNIVRAPWITWTRRSLQRPQLQSRKKIHCP